MTEMLLTHIKVLKKTAYPQSLNTIIIINGGGGKTPKFFFFFFFFWMNNKQYSYYNVFQSSWRIQEVFPYYSK
jgi:hypothetical protein